MQPITLVHSVDDAKANIGRFNRIINGGSEADVDYIMTH